MLSTTKDSNTNTNIKRTAVSNNYIASSHCVRQGTCPKKNYKTASHRKHVELKIVCTIRLVVKLFEEFIRNLFSVVVKVQKTFTTYFLS